MKVSIIIPIYNVAPYVKACLQSVFNQTYQDIEVLLVNDCGTDNSMDIVTNLIKGYDGKFDIKVLHHPQNKGLSAARNTGIKAASGEYIYFLDSDDTIPHDGINNLAKKVFEHPNVSFVIGGIKTFGQRVYQYPLLSQEYIDKNDKVLIDYLQFKWNVMACNKLINRDFILNNNIQFIEGVYHEDMDFSFRLAYYAQSMACCYDITYNYLIRKGSITTHKNIKNYEDYFSIFTHNFRLLNLKRDFLKQPSLIDNFIIENLYFLCIELIKEKNPAISKEKKENIIKKIQCELKHNQIKQADTIYFIKKTIINLPIQILSTLIKIYLKIKRIH